VEPQPHPGTDAERRERELMYLTLLRALDTPEAREAVVDGLMRDMQRAEETRRNHDC
jgi:hypothetical protein